MGMKKGKKNKGGVVRRKERKKIDKEKIGWGMKKRKRPEVEKDDK